MAIVLGVYYRSAVFFCAFFVGKMTQCKGHSQSNFSCLLWKCLSCNAVHNLVEKRGNRFADDKEAEVEVRKWLKQQSKEFYATGFDALVKR
jgi:hypothetical protein